MQIQKVPIFCLAELRADSTTLKNQFAPMELKRDETGYFNTESKRRESCSVGAVCALNAAWDVENQTMLPEASAI